MGLKKDLVLAELGVCPEACPEQCSDFFETVFQKGPQHPIPNTGMVEGLEPRFPVGAHPYQPALNHCCTVLECESLVHPLNAYWMY